MGKIEDRSEKRSREEAASRQKEDAAERARREKEEERLERLDTGDGSGRPAV